jgi:hypothetical protein
MAEKKTETLDAEALEAALPTLTKKLKELQKGLSEEEQAVLSSIVNSAALHLKSMQAIESTAEIQYAKPISAAATVGVRKKLLELPKTLGLNK